MGDSGSKLEQEEMKRVKISVKRSMEEEEERKERASR